MPDVAFTPLHAPLALHAVAFVLDHVSVEDVLYATDVGLASSETTGASGITGGAATVTKTDATAMPPDPLQVKVYVRSEVSDSVCSVPLVAMVPDQAPLPSHWFAFATDHASVVVALNSMAAGVAVKLIVGAGLFTVTETPFVTSPPAPLHVNVKSLDCVTLFTLSVPCRALLPNHAPAATHVVAPLAFQLSVTVPPMITLPGVALNSSAGALLDPPSPALVPGSAPPFVVVAFSTQAVNVTASKTAPEVLTLFKSKDWNQLSRNMFIMALTSTTGIRLRFTGHTRWNYFEERNNIFQLKLSYAFYMRVAVNQSAQGLQTCSQLKQSIRDTLNEFANTLASITISFGAKGLSAGMLKKRLKQNDACEMNLELFWIRCKVRSRHRPRLLLPGETREIKDD